jgi:hypothetical protein
MADFKVVDFDHFKMRLIDANEFNKKIEHIPMWGSVASYM